MRLNDDDKRVLAAIFHGAEPVGVSEKQVDAAGRTFKALGFTDESGSLTQRGRHVAKSLPFQKVKNGEFQRQGRAGVDSKSRSSYRGRDQAGPRDQSHESQGGSIVASEERRELSVDPCGDHADDLPEADRAEGADSGAVHGEPAVSSGPTVEGDRGSDC